PRTLVRYAQYSLALHDALPIFGTQLVSQLLAGAGLPGELVEQDLARNRLRVGLRHLGGPVRRRRRVVALAPPSRRNAAGGATGPDRKSTRLNSSHVKISYAVFG